VSDKDKWVEVDTYIDGLFVNPDPVLEAALAASEAAGLPAIEVAPSHGKLLMLLATIRGARRILEIGTLGGYSTIWLARALPADGRLISLEASAKHADVARANIEAAGLSGVTEVRVGQALDTLPKLEEEGAGPFDFVFIDADKSNNVAYFRWALKLSRPGTAIFADNVVRYGAVTDRASADASVKGTRSLLKLISEEPRVSATVIQTVSVKGHDGFALAVVKDEA
jgi:predicted O-methyltransferase YrrM